MPNVQNTYVDPLLTDISVAYTNNNLVADQIFPTVVVQKETGKYFISDKAHMRTAADPRRSEFGRANRVLNNLTSASYSLEEKSLETPISDRVMRNYSDPFQPKANATRLVTGQLAVNKEKDIVATLLAGAATSTDLATSWATISTDIIGQARTARNSILLATGQDANLCVIGKPAYDKMLENTALIDRIKYTSRADEATILNALSDFLGVERVIIAKGVENTAKEGQTDSLSYIWSDNVVFAYVTDAPAIESPSAGYHLQLQDARFVDEWYEQENKLTIVRANDFYDAKIVVPEAIYVYTNAV